MDPLDKPLAFVWDKRIYFAAAYFLLVQAVDVVSIEFQGPPAQWYLLWYCNHAPLLFALAFMARSAQVSKGIISVGLLAQTAWLADFFTRLVFGFYLFKITDYVFVEPLSVSNAVVIAIHTAVVPLALALTYNIRPRAVSLLYSLAYIAALYGITLLFTPAALNVNCVFQTCVFKTLLSFPQYTALWPFFMAILAIGGYTVQKWLHSYAVPKLAA
jgi:hypothetical protein